MGIRILVKCVNSLCCERMCIECEVCDGVEGSCER